MRLEPQQGIYVTAERLAELTGAHRTTVERWKRSQRLPRPVGVLLRIVAYGELELVHAAWAGWRVDRSTGALWPPAGGRSYSPAELLAFPLRLQQLHALELELARRRRPTWRERVQAAGGRFRGVLG